MSRRHPLLDVRRVGTLIDHLADVGTVFRIFDRQDSGCVSYGVALADERWFVKTATTRAAERALLRAVDVHAAVRHPAIVALAHRFTAAGVPVLVYPWVDGDLLYHPTMAGTMPRRDPRSVWSRFRRLPVAEVEAVVDAVLAVHVAVERAGFVVGDFYDGCLLYDFDSRRIWLIDLDEYRPGPYVATEQPCGSRRFMAPEEHVGGTVDTRTTVFNIGRGIRLLLDAGDDEAAWRGSAAQLAVVARAIHPDPADRYADVAELAAAWRT